MLSNSRKPVGKGDNARFERAGESKITQDQPLECVSLHACAAARMTIVHAHCSRQLSCRQQCRVV
jgi:hypothetical protein